MSRLLEIDEALLMVIDVQERLAPAMDSDIFPGSLNNMKILIETMKLLDVPVVVTEQYPKGLGATVPEIRDSLSGVDYSHFEKMTFCCLRDRDILEGITSSGRKQIILCGMEAHVCVYQTGIDLLQGGFEVYIVNDAVCSRKKENMESGIRGLVASGAVEITTETVGFSLLKVAGTPRFKGFSKLIK